MDHRFVGKAKRLDDIDLPKLGATIDVGEDEIHAFLDVETRGHGFDAKNRPIILFEPHVFYRNLAGVARSKAVNAHLAAKKWGAIPYGRESDQYPRLVKACEIDETAALKACSWGLGQVLGENFAAAGFLTVQDMVQAMMDDEENQLLASVNFILENHLDDELRRHDWAGFAKGYNGHSYRKNRYDEKLTEAFAKWSRIKDTPLPAAIVVTSPPKPSPGPVFGPPSLGTPIHGTVKPAEPVAPPAPPVAAKPSPGKTAAAAGFLAIIALTLATWWHEVTAWVSSLF